MIVLRSPRPSERGSAPVEFVLVGCLLVAFALGVLQLGLVVYVRNVVHDAAVEGAYHAALADREPADGVARTRTVIERAIGAAYAQDVTAELTTTPDGEAVAVRVRTPAPVVGFIGIPGLVEVIAHAPRESLG